MNDWQEHKFFVDLMNRQKAARFRRGKKTHRNLDFERAVTKRLVGRLRALGLADIARTIHTAHFDLWVENVRVEIKASRWCSHQRGGRYQANMRQSQADVVIFVAVNGCDHNFVIPHTKIARRKTLEITSYDVETYTGQWRDYLENWDVLLSAVQTAPVRTRQIEMEFEQ